MTLEDQDSDSSDSGLSENEVRDEVTNEADTTGSKRKRERATAAAKRPELMLDLSNPNDRIMDMLNKLRRKCDGWRTKPLRPAPQRSYDLASPVARIADGRPEFGYALHDFAVFAVRSYFDRNTCGKYTHDFKKRNGLVRGSRVPIRNGVAIDAYGILWIVAMSGRNLLTGEKLDFP